MAFSTIREFMTLLEQRGKLYRFTDPINKDTEMFPLFRVQMRGLDDGDRKVLSFENVVGADGRNFDMSVLMGVYGASEDVLCMHMKCANYQEALEKWHNALTHPIPPVMVNEGPVQEEVHTGEELKKFGLDEVPAPLEDPGFCGVIRTGLPMISKDPETGMRNVGAYNGMFRARDRIVAGVAPMHHLMSYHWKKAQERKEGLPVAIVVGPSMAVMLASAAPIPYGEDELAIAGGLEGAPIELVPCRTVPLEVPAHAELVIEGIISTEIGEPEGMFGEYPGYLNLDNPMAPVLQITAITHRKGAIFTPIQVSFAPSDCNYVQSFCQASATYHYLKYEWKLPIEDVYLPEVGGSYICMIRVEEGTPQETVWEALHAVQKVRRCKYTIAFDHDIDLHNPELLTWSLAFSTQPNRDFLILEGGMGGLDPA